MSVTKDGRSLRDELSPKVEPEDGLDGSATSISSAKSAWPLCGYAPGGYMGGACHSCGKQMLDVDKRAFECLECAARSANSLLTRARKVERAAIDLHDTIVLWREYGGPDPLPAAVEKAMAALLSTLDDETTADGVAS